MSRVIRSTRVALVGLAVAAAAPSARADWTRVSGPVPPPVSALAGHQGRWFLGTNFGDAGDLFVSDDAGHTWSDVGLPNGGVSMPFPFGGDLYLGAYLSGLFRSTDAGDSWQEVGGPFAGATVGAMTAVDAQTLIAGLQNFLGTPMLRSTDAGATWNSVAAGPSLICFDLALAGSVVLAGGGEVGVHRSTDAGVTWSGTSTGLPANASAYRFAVDGADVYLAAGTNVSPLAVYRSTDLGATWTQVSADLPASGGHVATTLFRHAGDLYLGTSSTFGERGLFRSANGGVNWTKVTASLPGEASVDAAAFLGDDLLVGTFDGAFRTTDAGATWAETWQGASGVAGAGAVAHEFGRLFAGVDGLVSSRNGVYATSDDGVTWQTSGGIVSGGTAVDFLRHGSALLAAVYGGIRGVYASTDGGDTFALSGNWSSGVVLQCLHGHAGVLLAGAADRYFRSTDDGATWSDSIALGWVRDFASLDGLLYAARYPGGVSRSSDAGVTWTDLAAGMPGAPHVNALAVFGGAVYAAVNVGPVMRWDGSAWIDVGLNGEGVNVLLPVDGTLLAGTAFGRVWAATDGSAWTDFSGVFTGGIIESMGVTPDRVIAGTRGRGIWSRPRAELPAATAAVAPAAPSSALRISAWPNPFDARTSVRFELSRPVDVTVDVFDASGRRLRRLLDGARPAGRSGVIWDGRDDRGRIAGNGVYFLRVRTGGGEEAVAKLLRIR